MKSCQRILTFKFHRLVIEELDIFSCRKQFLIIATVLFLLYYLHLSAYLYHAVYKPVILIVTFMCLLCIQKKKIIFFSISKSDVIKRY